MSATAEMRWRSPFTELKCARKLLEGYVVL
jgi:hypothetical protein